MPRSGSMWVFNVVRSLLNKAGLNVLPHTIPLNDKAVVDLARDASKDTAPNNVWCLKVHSVLRNASHASRFISTFRDPRDALVSFMRFTRCNFEHALWSARIWTKVCDYYRDLPRPFSLCLDFNRIVAEPKNVAGAINTFLDLRLSTQTIADAVAEFERDKVRQCVDNLQTDFERRRAKGGGELAALVPNMDGTTRLWDPATGFQSGHVSDYREGDWRVLLTDQEKERLDQVIGEWLSCNGFDRRLEIARLTRQKEAAGQPDVRHCQRCDDTGWICRNHPHRPWAGASERADACGCGIGMPCPELQHHRAGGGPVS